MGKWLPIDSGDLDIIIFSSNYARSHGIPKGEKVCAPSVHSGFHLESSSSETCLEALQSEAYTNSSISGANLLQSSLLITELLTKLSLASLQTKLIAAFYMQSLVVIISWSWGSIPVRT